MGKKGIAMAFITLHVGSGTFQPIKTEDINQHTMHQEIYNIPKSIIKKIAETKAKNGRIVAIGTTVLRALESAYEEDIIKTGYNETDIFIKPGFNFKVVDALFTNFHLPKSTLLMLVSAFAGSKFIKAIYRHAVDNKYRFFSYGDAMFIEQKVKNQDEQV
jgi:S-adenosylmethionine:tRNA ribosyltransferase-isomerase